MKNINARKLTFLILFGFAFVCQMSAQVVREKPRVVYGHEERYVLAGLTVDDVAGFDNDLLLSISGLSIGREYEIPGADITEALRRYWSQKLFSDVGIDVDSIIGNRAYLHIRLKAHPRISAINYEGVKKTERQDLERSLGLLAGSQITTDLVDRAKEIIKRHFEGKGFKNIEVDIRQRDDVTRENCVIVDIIISKNQRIKVSNIYISGVTEREARKLKRAMKKTHEKSLINIFRSKKFLPEKYEEDKGYVIDRMNAWGYRDALITADSIETIDDAHVNVYMTIHKGQRYYVRNIEWVGNTLYPTQVLSRILQMNRGDVYDQKHLNERLFSDDDAVHNNYYNTGYVFSRIDPVETNVVGDSVDLEIRIREGQQATFNRVNITGNDRVYENVIRRELRTKPGDLFSMEAIKRSVMEIAQMQQFDVEALGSALNRSIKPDEENGTVDITYPLESKGGDQFQISAGWGPTGVVGTVGVKFTNFSMQNLFSRGNRRKGFIPQGDGQTLSINAQTNGTYYQSYSLSFLDPWFGGKRPNQFSVGIYYNKMTDVNSRYYSNSYLNNYYNSYLYGAYGSNSSYYNYTNYYDPDKYVKMLGVSVGFGKRLRWPDDHFMLMAELSYTRYMLKSWQYFLITDGNCNNFNLTLSLSRSSVDNTFFPRTGSEFSFAVTATPPYSLWDGIDYKNLATNSRSSTYRKEAQQKYRWIEYNKWKFKFRTFTAFMNVPKAPVLMSRVEFGILGSYNRYKKSPFEAFYVGGDGMSGYTYGYATETIGLRGYENGSLAGLHGDNAYAYSRMTLELRYPLMLEGQTNIFALAFVEGGNAWQDVKKFNPFDMKRSAGVGVRLMLPMIGMLGIDWAYGFQRRIAGEKAGGSQIHFILNQEF